MAAVSKTAKARQSWSRWYEKNAASHNEKRKAKYHSDPEYRQKVLESRKEARRNAPKPEVIEHFKVIKGKKVQVVRVGEASEHINRDPQVIRIWEREGKIPRPTVPGAHRYYTMGQLALLKEFADLMTEVRYSRLEREAAVKAKSAELFAQWKKA